MFARVKFGDPNKDLSTDVDGAVLIDSGADGTLISLKLIKKLGLESEIYPSRFESLQGLGKDGEITITGDIRLRIQIGGYMSPCFPCTVVAEQGMGEIYILGGDFLAKHYLVPDLARRKLFYNPNENVKETLSLKIHNNHCVGGEVFTISKSKLKPLSIMHIRVKAPNIDLVNGCFEPYRDHKYSDAISLSRTVVTLDSNCEFDIKIINSSNSTIVLPVDFPVGSINDIDVSDDNMISEVYDGFISCVESTSLTQEVPNDETLLNMFDWNKMNLDQDQKEKVTQVMLNHKSAISVGDHDVGFSNVNAHTIELMDQRPIKIPPRRIQGTLLDEIENELSKLEKDGIIRPSVSPFSAPIVPIRKKDGSLRLCIDYRKLNKVTVKDSFPLPNLTDTIYNLSGAKFFSSLDMVRGYYQLPVDEESKKYTAFSTTRSHWEFNRLPFGLCNSPATFQRAMSLVLAGFTWDEVMIYLDDILLVSSNFESHLKLFETSIREIFQVWSQIETW